MKHTFENDNGDIIYQCEKIDKTVVIPFIIDYLNNNPKDTVYHLINGIYTDFYSITPHNNKPSKEIQKGNKTYYKSLEL